MLSQILDRLGIPHGPGTRLAIDPPAAAPSGAPAAHDAIEVASPTTGRVIARVAPDSSEQLDAAIARAQRAFLAWRAVPAPERGQVVRAVAEAFRAHRDTLGQLVSLEVGKIRSEGVGEIQEIIDIADLAVGLSRQLPGKVFPSERPAHRLYEQWLPLGPVGVITAFNFPAAVWGWNAMLAAVCGDTVLWKPSPLAPLTAIACHHLADSAAAAAGHPGVFHLIVGSDDAVARPMAADPRLPLVSATGSVRMGRSVGQTVAARLGRALLELGGNNACIVHHDADPDLALRAVLFGAVGTAGQRCTTTRRLLLHSRIAEPFLARLTAEYRRIIDTPGRIGDPLAEATLVGPLINRRAVDSFLAAVASAQRQGGRVLAGGRIAEGPAALLGGHFVQPTLIAAPPSPAPPSPPTHAATPRTHATADLLPIACDETFAPILYAFTYDTDEQALELHNSVPQGLASAVFTDSLRFAERFLAPDGSGSDCGLAYVNMGTSGAEIGGAFGGEKDTGGGRESGSDAWKHYMRRQTCGVNASGQFRLAQGVRFGS
ncbi:MAG: aldehyde dehydrogenase family protein [Planctomyces sp.]|nr:aldehyde dehydrogenase family protein [Planctomyces sp.]